MNHHCHARGCKVPIPPELLFCLPHWRMVPRAIQQAVWRHYRPGQCDDKSPSKEWHEAADAAIAAVAKKEASLATAKSAVLAKFKPFPPKDDGGFHQ